MQESQSGLAVDEAVPMSSTTDNDVMQDFCTENSENFESGSSGFASAPIFIEACAGCGILSSVVQQRGIQVIPIDCPRNRHVPKCRLVVMDLTSDHADALLRRIVADYNIAGVHIALPCGTCSKARGIPLPDGSAGPPPLRDHNNLHGMANLSALDRAKIDAANQLYAWADSFVQYLHSKGIPWTIENPSNSWLWEMPEMSFALAHGIMVHLHACAYGGERKKRTAFLCSNDEFAELEKFCDGTHPHKEWGYDYMRTRNSTLRKRLNIPRPYANNMQIFWKGWHLVTTNFKVDLFLWRRHDLINNLKVERCRKSFLSMLQSVPW